MSINGRATFLRAPLHLRQWQAEALSIWSEQRRGIVKVVTGAGKTRFAEACIDRFWGEIPAGRVLVVVPTVALLDQWFVALSEDFDLRRDEIALFGGGIASPVFKRVNIAVVNSAAKFQQLAWASKGMAIFDECHRFATERHSSILRQGFGATVGLSATPERQYDDGLDAMLVPSIGPVFYSYPLARALDDGILHPFRLSNIQVELLPEERKKYEQMTGKVARMIEAAKKRKNGDDDVAIRRVLLARSRLSNCSPVRIPVAVSLLDGHREEQSIVFHEDIDAAQSIADLLCARGHAAAAYHSKLGSNIRWDNLLRFRRGEINALVCCRALDEGVDVPHASVGVIAASSASTRQRIQRLGRMLRSVPGKRQSIVYTLFASAAERRRLEAEEMNLEDAAQVEWFVADMGTR